MSEYSGWQRLRRRTHSRRAVLAASARAGIGAAGLALVGCGDDDDNEAAAQTEEPAPTDEEPAPADEEEPTEEPAPDVEQEPDQEPAAVTDVQVLNVAHSGEPDSLDPQRATDSVSISTLKQIYVGLTELAPNGTVTPGIAAELPTLENGGISADGMTYTFKLRDGLQWSDGTPLVAQDLVNGAKRLFEAGSGNFYVDFFRIIAAGGLQEQATAALAAGDDSSDIEAQIPDALEVSAPDDRTVVYQLTRPSPVFLLLSQMWPLYPVRQDVIDANGEQWTDAGTHISNGRWMLETWNHDQNISLVRNPNYHGDPPALERINIDQNPDRTVQFLAYQEGEQDILWLDSTNIPEVRDSDTLRAEFTAVPQQQTLGVYFNFDVPELQDVRVRQAMAMALDREQYAEVVLEGSALPAYSWLPPGLAGYDEERGRELYFNRPVEDAQALLAEAGYPDGAGLALEMLVNDSSSAQLTSEWEKEQWETKLGIAVTLRVLETATYVAERNNGNYQLTAGGWGSDYPDPQNWMPLFRSGGLLNNGNFSNADYDALVTEADTELDNDRRIELYAEANRLFMEQLPFAPLNHRVKSVLVKPYVKGWTPYSGDSELPGDQFLENISIEGKSA